MDYFDTINSSKEAEIGYANWYSQLPAERKAKLFSDLFQFSLDLVKYNVKKENPFITEADQMLKYVEYNLKDGFPPSSYEVIQKEYAKRSEKEWNLRFRKMKKDLGWTYEEIARFIGAENGNSVKSSISRKIPAFAKLAVCVFEAMNSRSSEEIKNENQI